MVILSILMATTPQRHEMFNKLFMEVQRQNDNLQRDHRTLGLVEILVDDSIRFLDGGLSVGKKREALLKRAEGKYVCYLDSDESISPDYLETLVRLCNQGADVCTFRAFVKLANFWALVDMRLAYPMTDQISPEYTVRRSAWHICPIKREHAQRHHFADINNAEDSDWLKRVLAHCTTEAHTERIIFQYSHGSHSEVDLIPLP